MASIAGPIAAASSTAALANVTLKERAAAASTSQYCQGGGAREPRRKLPQQLHPLATHRRDIVGEAGEVSTRMREARHEAAADRIAGIDKDDRRGAVLLFQGCGGG